MSTPILATKLYIPPPRPQGVLRPRLLERLNQGLHCKLTLISAPAGFGKTTLVSEWLAGEPSGPKGLQEQAVAWLSLDEGDDDPTRFLAYLVAALQTIAPKLGDEVLVLLHSAQPPPTESILTTLLNELATIANDFVLVLDDYHVIEAQPVDHALAFLLEHLPPQMHLVITTREDPPLPLARYRARGHLVELRATDLRFTGSEAADFLNQVMGLNLSAQEIAVLESRTEGWIAGLQLAALSMQGQQDVPGFIRAFAGDHRYIVDYLVEEVLHQQPESVQTFLLHTSILDRLSGPLCDAVTGQAEGNARLEVLERGNFFVVPLDDKRHWYRYHHLFADVLQARLREEEPEQVAVLHQRASVWYEQQGSTPDAIRHALAAQDFTRAAGLVELAVPAMLRSRQEATLLGWLKVLPDQLVHVRPVLSAAYASALLSSGELEGVEARLWDAERWLDMTADMRARPHPEGSRPPAETCPEQSQRMVVVDKEEFRRLPGAIAVSRGGRALALGDVADTVKYARRALELLPEDDHLGRGAAAALLGLASWTNGDLEAAHRKYAEGMASLQRAGHISDAIGGVIALADIRIVQGRLHEAMRTYEQALQLATEQGTPALRGTADMYVGMSELYREHNDLGAAMQHLLRSKEQGEHIGFPQNPYRWCVVMARIREAQGDLNGALDLLYEAERLYVSDFFPNVHPVPALKTRVWVAQSRLDEALGWARERGLSAHDDLSYLREFEHITLARVLLARYQSDRAERTLLEAMGLLERLLQAAEAGGRTGRVIEILVLQALAHQMQGDIPAALVPLQQALTLAEPEGYIRMFVDEGPPMAQLLLETAAPRGHPGITPEYIGKLLAAFGVEQPRNAGQTHIPTFPASQPLIESLSQRELEVLRLFKSELSGPEIAHELVIALSTVRTHTKGIYSKLNVNSRRAAVKRATELDLI
jgi:LuxR family maltose regulon positive regulatory protein